MKLFEMELSFTVRGHESVEQLEEHLDCVSDHLVDLAGVIDPDLTATLASGRVDFTLSIEAADEPSALAAALNAIRTAIHAEDGCTPGWEAHFDSLQQTVRSADLADA